jgi:lysophospholipase L1-like esterase
LVISRTDHRSRTVKHGILARIADPQHKGSSIMKQSLLFALALSFSATVFGQSNETSIETLPKVVLVGDSIRLSYAPIVVKQLDGKADVVSPQANGGDSSNVLKNLDQWVIREKPAVVHFNCGIHDTKHFTATGKFQVPPEQYEANLRKIVQRVRKETDAVVLFATTTPILDDRAATARKGRDYELLGSSVERYNAIARKVMEELNVPVNDLHAAMSKPDRPLTTEQLIGADGVHLTTPARELLGKRIAVFIGEHLPQ